MHEPESTHVIKKWVMGINELAEGRRAVNDCSQHTHSHQKASEALGSHCCEPVAPANSVRERRPPTPNDAAARRMRANTAKSGSYPLLS